MASQQRCDVIFEAAVMETSQGNCKATSKAEMEASQGDYRPTRTPERKLRWRNPGLKAGCFLDLQLPVNKGRETALRL